MTSRAEALDNCIERFRSRLGDNDRAFLRRVYGTPADVYAVRIAALGLVGLERVLDAGAGFGQWTMELARSNGAVNAIDASDVRVDVVATMAQLSSLSNIATEVASVDKLPFDDASFDAVFCYGVLFCADWRRALREFARVLKDGGRMYATANEIGWSVNLWVNRPNETSDYAPQQVAAQTLENTLRYEQAGVPPTGGQVIISHAALRSELTDCGLLEVALGDEGTIQLDMSTPAPTPFFPGKYFGLPGCYEFVAEKAVTSSAKDRG